MNESPTPAHMHGFLIVLPDISRIWLQDCPELNAYAVDQTIRAMSIEMDHHPEMTPKLEQLIRDLKEHMPEDKLWHEQAVD